MWKLVKPNNSRLKHTVRRYEFSRTSSEFSSYDTHRKRGLVDMYMAARETTRPTFLNIVGGADNLREMELNLGYAYSYKTGTTMRGDKNLKYYRSELFGERVYYFTKDGVAYIYCEVKDA